MKPSAARILTCLQRAHGRALSKRQLWAKTQVWNVGGRVLELRREGYDIRTEYVAHSGVRYGAYRLA